MVDSAAPNLHEDMPLFREAVNFTAARTGFNPRLIEKDYFCTVLLAYLYGCGSPQLVFKGGTCLAKVHAGFYRLSEDLDFAIPLGVGASRAERRSAAAETKDAIARLPGRLRAFTVKRPLTGANNSTQYNGAVEYQSPTTGQPETILIEVSCREPLLMPPGRYPARTLLLDPINGEALLPDIAVNCIAMREAMAEKFRAALSRRDVAIRDFYDLDFAISRLGLDPSDPDFVEMVRRKLAIPGNDRVDIGEERLAAVRRQLEARLRAVLRSDDFDGFDLERAVRHVTEMVERLSRS